MYPENATDPTANIGHCGNATVSLSFQLSILEQAHQVLVLSAADTKALETSSTLFSLISKTQHVLLEKSETQYTLAGKMRQLPHLLIQ
jgi:hypothetical protein